METLRTLTREARYTLAVLALIIVGLVVGLAVTGDEMDNLARLVFAVGIASACIAGIIVLMSEAHDRDINTLTRSCVARITALNDKHREVETERDAYRTALETVTRDAYRTRTTGEALDLATFLADYQEDGDIWHAFGAIFTGNEYAYGTWDEYDARALARAVAKWNTAVIEHPVAYPVAQYTHSASTALALGTLDRAYKVNGETRYPLATTSPTTSDDSTASIRLAFRTSYYLDRYTTTVSIGSVDVASGYALDGEHENATAQRRASMLDALYNATTELSTASVVVADEHGAHEAGLAVSARLRHIVRALVYRD